MYQILGTAGTIQVWESQDPELLDVEMENILDFYVQKYQAEDEERCANSTYSTTYKNINSGYEMQEYLEKDCPIHIKRTVSQLRTAGKRPYINMKGIIYSWNAEEMCTVCNMQVNETIAHILTECPMYNDPRNIFLGTYIRERNSIEIILRTRDVKQMFKLHSFIREAMKIRSFIIND